MLSAGRMTERVMVYRKETEGVSPEDWEADDIGRRAAIHRVSDRAALEEDAQYNVNVTHHAFVDYHSTAFVPEGSGSRLLKRLSDGQEFLITRAIEVGRAGRTGKRRFMRLSLSAISPAQT